MLYTEHALSPSTVSFQGHLLARCSTRISSSLRVQKDIRNGILSRDNKNSRLVGSGVFPEGQSVEAYTCARGGYGGRKVTA